MQFTTGNIYHIYNRGNNRQQLFFDEGNYLYFLRLFTKFVQPKCDLLAWCLMPNHFHFLIHANEVAARRIPGAIIPIQELSEGLRLLLSAYTKAINKKYNRTGNLFQQKTKSKCITDGDANYGLTAFHYIHLNPVRGGLVPLMEEWPYSSYREYSKLVPGNFRNLPPTGSLCNLAVGVKLLELMPETFYIPGPVKRLIDEEKIF